MQRVSRPSHFNGTAAAAPVNILSGTGKQCYSLLIRNKDGVNELEFSFDGKSYFSVPGGTGTANTATIVCLFNELWVKSASGGDYTILVTG